MRHLFRVGDMLDTGGWNRGGAHDGIKKRLMAFWSSCESYQASCPKICAWQMILGYEERDEGEGGVTT